MNTASFTLHQGLTLKLDTVPFEHTLLVFFFHPFIPHAISEDLFCREPFGISIFKRAIESARQKTGKGHQVSCRLKPPHSIKFLPCCHRPAHAKLRDCPFFSPVTLRGSFSTPAPETLIGLNKPSPPLPSQKKKNCSRLKSVECGSKTADPQTI